MILSFRLQEPNAWVLLKTRCCWNETWYEFQPLLSNDFNIYIRSVWTLNAAGDDNANISNVERERRKRKIFLFLLPFNRYNSKLLYLLCPWGEWHWNMPNMLFMSQNAEVVDTEVIYDVIKSLFSKAVTSAKTWFSAPIQLIQLNLILRQ